MLTAPALTVLLLGVIVGLTTAFVWMFWEIEQASRRKLQQASKERLHRYGGRPPGRPPDTF